MPAPNPPVAGGRGGRREFSWQRPQVASRQTTRGISSEDGPELASPTPNTRTLGIAGGGLVAFWRHFSPDDFLHNGWCRSYIAYLSIRMSFYWIPRMPGYITCVIIKTSPSSSEQQDFYKMVSGTVVNLFRIKKINNPCKHFKSLERPSVIVNQFHTLTTWAD